MQVSEADKMYYLYSRIHGIIFTLLVRLNLYIFCPKVSDEFRPNLDKNEGNFVGNGFKPTTIKSKSFNYSTMISKYSSTMKVAINI